MQIVFRLLVNARALLCFMLFSVATGSSFNQAKHSYPPEQRKFSAEDLRVKRVKIPPEVLALLKKDETVQIMMENDELPVDKLPPSWFSASAIHLSNAKRTDLVVVGVGPILGANVTTFWVFCATDHGYELVMEAPAHDLVVKNTRWKGYRDIELLSATAVQVSTVWLRFNGKQYVRYKAKSEMIR